MRIVAGGFRGRRLLAPPGSGTRPTADRVRQAVFDALLHAAWGGRGLLDGAEVLDVFAGTGALGLEALSRGAAYATFVENDKAALTALRANVSACHVTDRATICACDALAITATKKAAKLAFLDPPYGRDLVPRALARLSETGWIESGTIVVAEAGRNELLAARGEYLAERTHGAARIVIWRA